MEYMREMGYDFYEIKVLDEWIGRGFSSEGVDGLSYAMSEELLDFNDDADYQLIDSERDT